MGFCSLRPRLNLEVENVPHDTQQFDKQQFATHFCICYKMDGNTLPPLKVIKVISFNARQSGADPFHTLGLLCGFTSLLSSLDFVSCIPVFVRMETGRPALFIESRCCCGVGEVRSSCWSPNSPMPVHPRRRRPVMGTVFAHPYS